MFFVDQLNSKKHLRIALEELRSVLKLMDDTAKRIIIKKTGFEICEYIFLSLNLKFTGFSPTCFTNAALKITEN